MRSRMLTSINITKRRGFYTFHNLDIGFSNSHIADTISYLNPNYFSDQQTSQKYFSLGYSFTRDFRDFSAYPLNGFYLNIQIDKYGLGIFNDVDKTEVNAIYSRYFDLGKKFYYASSLSGKMALVLNWSMGITLSALRFLSKSLYRSVFLKRRNCCPSTT